MKKWIALSLALVLLLSTVTTALAQVTTIVPIFSGPDDFGTYTSLKLDSNGIPVISARSQSNGLIYLVRCSNTACINGNSKYSIGLGSDNSLALNSSGNPVISYYKDSSQDLVLVTCDDAVCSTAAYQTVASTGNVGQYNSLKLDSSGYPVISYYDATNKTLNLAYCIGNVDCTSGLIVGRTLDNAADVGRYSSLALNSSGYPVVAYYDADNGDLKLVVCSDSTCVAKAVVTVDSTGTVGVYPSLVLNGSDYPIISYFDSTNNHLKLVACGNTTCTSGNTFKTVDSSPNNGTYSSIALNASGNPVISYREYTIGSLKLAICGNSTCTANNVIKVMDGASSPQFVSMALNASGDPYVGYYDYSSGDLKLAYGAETFSDVPANYWSWQYIERLYSAGITGGCLTSPLIYCPTTTVTRDQMAVFLLRGEHGSTYNPPAATGTMFADVPSSHWAAAWIEQLAKEGITTGCGGGSYCPVAATNRAQMAVFLVKAFGLP